MYDHTVECPPQVIDRANMHFYKLGIADRCVTDSLKLLDDLILANGHQCNNDMVLKMDVEGAEWGFLEMVPTETLVQFRQIVFEFHDMNTLEEAKRCSRINGLHKLYLTHRVIHVHGNNHGGYLTLYDHNFPRTWEVTYLRKDLIGEEKKDVVLPISIDNPCNDSIDEIVLGNWNQELSFTIGRCPSRTYSY